MLSQARYLASGSFVPSNRSTVGCRTRSQVPYLQRVSSSGGGLFKRPVILWIRDASYFCGEVAKAAQVSARFALARILAYYFPSCFVTVGTSSLFPDAKLR